MSYKVKSSKVHKVMNLSDFQLYGLDKLSTDSRGVVALIVSIVVGLLLVLISVSATTIMAGELRQAEDFDNSIKAYFAAESGVEDAIAQVRRFAAANPGAAIPQKQSCAPYSAASADLVNGDNNVAN